MTVSTEPLADRLARIHEENAHLGVNAVAKRFAEVFHGEIFDAQTTAKMERGLADLLAHRVADGVLKVGQIVPDFELPDARGGSVRLSDRLASGPAIIVFYRGQWCPYCNLHLAEFNKRLQRIKEAGGSLIAISPQTADNSLSTAEKNELGFSVLSDRDNLVAEAFGLAFDFSEELRATYKGFGVDLALYNGEKRWRLPIPGTFVIGRDLSVRAVWADPDYRVRAEPDDVLAALERVTKARIGGAS